MNLQAECKHRNSAISNVFFLGGEALVSLSDNVAQDRNVHSKQSDLDLRHLQNLLESHFACTNTLIPMTRARVGLLANLTMLSTSLGCTTMPPKKVRTPL